FIGEHPDLHDLDAAGNLIFNTDFRQVYQTVLTDWLCFPAPEVEHVLNSSFENLDLGFSCNTTRVVSTPHHLSEIKMYTHHPRHFTFSIDMPSAVYGRVIVYDMQGRKVVKLHRGLLHQGVNTFELNTTNNSMGPGMYIFTVFSGASVAKRKFMVV
nr:T9SS type A sorting domain-containing protein [Saprospiraceae bacterium]